MERSETKNSNGKEWYIIILQRGYAMSKKDKVKEKITYFRFWLGVAVATILAIIGWVLTNSAKVELWLLFLSFIAIIILLVMIIAVMRNIDKKIDELEDL